MKNKRLIFILALVCALALSLCLVACNPDGGDDGGGKTIQGLVIVDKDGVEQTEYNLPDVVYGTGGPNFSSIRLCYKYSDGTVQDVKDDDTEISVTWYHNGDQLNGEPTSYQLGLYSVTYTREYSSVTVNFRFVASAVNSQYSIYVSENTWPYLSELPTVTVKDRDVEIDCDEDHLYYVTEAEYTEIRAAENFEEAINNKQRGYNAYTMVPGVYYMFAKVGNYTSTFVRVTVTKATPTFENLDVLYAAEYRYGTGDEVIGKINLSDIEIKDYVYESDYIEVKAIDSRGSKVYGTFVWQTPGLQVDCRDSGHTRPVKFVPEEPDKFNEVTYVAEVNLTITPGYVFLPTAQQYQPTYDGSECPVRMGTGTADYATRVTATRNNVELSITVEDSNATVERVTDAGTYNYTLSLKDKVNYYWVDIDDYDERYNPTVKLTDDQIFVFTMKKASSAVYLRSSDYPQLVPDKNGEIKIEVGSRATPHQLGTLEATYSATDERGVNRSSLTANVTVMEEGGKEYLVISNIESESDDSDGYLYVRFTAVVSPNYEDMDYIISDALDIYFQPTYLGNWSSGELTVYAGITAQKLYDNNYWLKTTVGEWQLQMEQGSGNWLTIGMEEPMPEGTYNFRLHFVPDNNFGEERETPADVALTIIAENIIDYPIAEGARIEAPVDQSLVLWLKAHYSELNIPEETGVWVVQVKDMWGNWTDWSDSMPIPEGEIECRLVFTKPYGWYYQPDFGVEFTVIGITQND